MRADIGIRGDLDLFQARETTVTGNPFISKVERSPKQLPQAGLYLTDVDYITIGPNITDTGETIKMVEVWVENSLVGNVIETTGFTVEKTTGGFTTTGGTVVSNLNMTGRYTILLAVLDTAVNEPIIVKNGHVTRLVIYTEGSIAAATDVLGTYLGPTTMDIEESVTFADVSPVINDNTWAIKSSG